MRILVAAAVPQELSRFREDRSRGIECLVTGVGRRASEAVARRLARGGVDWVVSAGFAGGVRPGLRVGELVAASRVIDGDTGRQFEADLSKLSMNGNLKAGPFVTVSQPVREPHAKFRLGSRFEAIAVEMETAGIAEAAQRAGVAWVGVRAILDPMEETLPAGSLSQALLCTLFPPRWGAFSDLLKGVGTASRSLGSGLDKLTKGESSDGSG